MMNKPLYYWVLPVFALLAQLAHAEPKIGVLVFELNDITALPNTPEERLRTASIQPLLAEALSKFGDAELVNIGSEAQQAANSSFGVLFKADETAAKLGEQYHADWIIVSQHSKPSFLFSYLMSHIIDVHSQQRVAAYSIELKGNHAKVMQRGVNTLAKKIHATISKHTQGKP